MAIKPIFAVIPEQYDSIECNFYSSIAAGAYSAALASAFTGQWYATGGAALIGGAAELTAQLAGCNDPKPPWDFHDSGKARCWKCQDGEDAAVRRYTDEENYQEYPGLVANEVLFARYNGVNDTGGNIIAQFKRADGTEFDYVIPGNRGDKIGLGCTVCTTDPDLPPHTPGEPISQPYEVDDGTCRWSVQATDSYVDDAGYFHVYYVITAVGDTDGSCGGPFSYWSTKNGPSWRPVAPGPNPPTPPPGTDPNPPLPTPPDYGDDFDGINDKLDEIKQCACDEKPPKPPLEGDWVTTQWKADEKDDVTGTRLRKRFRYRSKSSRDLKQLSDYWKDFTWQAGPVCVRHQYAWWGDPQVWAASAEEGKRVIRFAAGEAGIDPDSDGEWAVSGSRSPRVGKFGTMRLIDKDGFPWVASRDGAAWPNYLAR